MDPLSTPWHAMDPGLPRTFRGGARAPEVVTACKSLGPQLGGRLVALLRKWSSVPASQARPSAPRGREAVPMPKEPRVESALDDKMRSKFVGILMRTVSQTDKACFDACSKIERALFEKCGKDPKEYRRRARSWALGACTSYAWFDPQGLSHNLGSGDGELLRQVLSGQLTPEQLVALEGEDLAPAHFRQPWWIAGMCAFVLGQAANIPAMALAPQTMLSCLGGLSLVFNSTYAHILLGERLKWTEIAVMFAMVMGAVMVVSVTPVYANQIFHSILKPAFTITAACVVLTLIFLKILSKQLSYSEAAGLGAVSPAAALPCPAIPRFRPHPLKIIFLGLTCAATGSYSMTFFKCGAEVVGETSRWWMNLELYVLGLVALGVVCVQIFSMNQGLKHGDLPALWQQMVFRDVVIVIPTFFALGVLFSLIQAQLAFGELNDLKGIENILIFATGVVLVIGSTVALLMLHTDEEEDDLPPVDAEQVPAHGVSLAKR
eukprot:Skav229158  [mRNA]  locus=scaffold1381:21349:37961:+ [translate_table: standard]